ncbi:type II toxin-antitoxin system CcdA family antitoxin [Glycocaulis abyssi]|uniref:Type II toxin-antitoxin system CcdA family antitoxin n=1 Tax=Glycocaulis abyssi TaxID=1433403 RepID=A0ABV9NHN4_9PROT
MTERPRHKSDTNPAAKAWRQQNRRAIAAHNRRVQQHGVLLVPEWATGIEKP